ncbi:MAG: type II secretion system protein [Pseudomonadota bacterium]|nr:type II secretion system protein [Pseudomonadota bacterium]MDE3038313.1 type II secretion system protein [Pseudomonadota bacterium]
MAGLYIFRHHPAGRKASAQDRSQTAQEPAPRRRLAQDDEKAFTLLEMSIVLVIIATVIVGGMTMFSAALQKRQLQETQAKLAAIQKALLDYRVAMNRIPCPADVTIAIGSANFGVEASAAGDCYNTGAVKANFQNLLQATNGATTSGSTTITYHANHANVSIAAGMSATGAGIPGGDSLTSATPAQGTLVTAATATASGLTFTFLDNVEGMVPTKTLRLPDDYAIDGWGRRIMYAVDARFTAGSAFIANPTVDGPPPPCTAPCTPNAATRMTVNDASGNPKTTAAAYVLLSFGPNGHGAFPRGSGTTPLTIPASRISSGSVNADELKNCDCNSATPPIAQNTGGIFGVFVQKLATQDSATLNHTNDFDDIVVYGTRADLHSPTESGAP